MWGPALPSALGGGGLSARSPPSLPAAPSVVTPNVPCSPAASPERQEGAAKLPTCSLEVQEGRCLLEMGGHKAGGQ